MKLRCPKCKEELIGEIAPDSPKSVGVMVIEVEPCVNCTKKAKLEVVEGTKKKLNDG